MKDTSFHKFGRNENGLERRRFFKVLVGMLAGAAGLRMLPMGASMASSEGNPPISDQETGVYLTGLAMGASVKKLKMAVREAVLAASDFSWLSRGDTVFIKPALNSGQTYPSTTHPEAIAAVIELLREKGAGRIIVGDMSGIEHVKLTARDLSGSTRKLMETSGMAGAVQAAGAELHFFEEEGWHAFYEDPMESGAHWKRGLMMPDILKTVDHIILMPRCSRHVLAGATLGLKAAVGYWRTDTRLEYHRDAATLHEKTAEANTAQTLLSKQRLVISAADKILTTFGPDDGYVHEPEIGLIIASASVVAHDMVSLAWLLENRRYIPAEEKNRFIDNSAMVAMVANYWVVHKLGGLMPSMTSQRLVKNDLQHIWDDRVLNRAYHVFKGVPKVMIHDADNNLPAELTKLLKGMVKAG
jgi:uncharacterized protein (DUF362 family)